MTEYEVAEQFISINGEGRKAGQPALFLRLHGCNLHCSYCDTRWACEPDCRCEKRTAAQILQTAADAGISNVTLTGGEPLLAPQIGELLEALSTPAQIYVEVETNGSVPLEPFAALSNRPSFTMDYKLPGSGMESRMHLPNLLLLDRRDTVKFVIGSRADLDRAAAVAREYDLIRRTHVYFSPVFGLMEPKEIAEYMIQHRMNGVTLQLQLHKIIWGPEKRGV